MPDINLLLLFFASSLLLGLAPGPDNLFVMAQSAQHGKKAGLLVTLGLCTGLLVHTSAVALGLAAVFRASELAFTALKFAGAAYLLYLAWRAFRATASDAGAALVGGLNVPRLYARGIVMNVTNPKVSIFFLAFLPQFTDPAKGAIAPQVMLLGGIFIVATILVFGSISLLVGTLGERFRRSAMAQKLLNWAAGSIFAGLAVRLAIAER